MSAPGVLPHLPGWFCPGGMLVAVLSIAWSRLTIVGDRGRSRARPA